MSCLPTCTHYIFNIGSILKETKHTCQKQPADLDFITSMHMQGKPMSILGYLSTCHFNTTVSIFSGSNPSATKDLSYFFSPRFLHGIHLLEHSVYKFLLLGDNEFSHLKKKSTKTCRTANQTSDQHRITSRRVGIIPDNSKKKKKTRKTF